ncbi:MAG: alpha/beta hydrolase [Phormidesmis sp.]
MQGWWLPATPDNPYVILPDEPQQVVSTPKTILYFCGVGRNMGDYNYLSRVAAFQQLGFSVLVFDYRGYGHSSGAFPHETQLYEDGQAAWNYLLEDLRIPAEQVILYGESLGGAVALNLAVQQPDAAGLIMQSSFTTMVDAVKHRSVAKFLPVELILSEEFDSLARLRSLEIPVLFLHGSHDSVVPVHMSYQLYDMAPQPKQQLIIPGVDHVSINKPGENSYLEAIKRFETQL